MDNPAAATNAYTTHVNGISLDLGFFIFGLSQPGLFARYAFYFDIMFKFFNERRQFIPDSQFAQGLEKVPLDSDPTYISPPSDHRKFVCPGCDNKTLSIQRSIELGADSRDDEYSLQAVKCSGCDFVGVATYQESRRGAAESWNHLCYRMEGLDFEVFLEQLQKCRQPTKPKCSCEAHSNFRVMNEQGKLRPLDKLQFNDTHFVMRFR